MRSSLMVIGGLAIAAAMGVGVQVAAAHTGTVAAPFAAVVRLPAIRDVTICEVMQSPYAYDLKRIRLSARVEMLGDGGVLLRDADCPYTPLRLVRPAHAGAGLARLQDSLAHVYAGDRRAAHFAVTATLTGVFDAQGGALEPALRPTDAGEIDIMPAAFWPATFTP